MIPVTFPSSLSSGNIRQMVVYVISPTATQMRWVDYIPIKFATPDLTQENTYEINGYIAVDVIENITNRQAWKDYIPVVIDSTATDAYTVSLSGYIPTAYAGGAVQSFNFDDGLNALSSKITFSRSSNGTIVNSNGQIAYAPHNLVLNSENFEASTWTKNAVTLTPNAGVAPDGTTTADLFVPSTTNSTHYVIGTSVGQINNARHTLRVKENGYYKFALRESASTGAYASFDLQTGTVLDTGTSGLITAVSATITPSTNGYYIVDVLFTGFSINGFGFWAIPSSYTTGQPAATNWSGDGASGYYIWGAQLTVGSTVYPYNSTTPKNLLGFTEEFDNAAWTKSNSFVQTNLLAYSEAFDNAYWTKYGTTSVTADTTTAPNGYQTADTLTGATDIIAGSNNLYRVITSLTSSTAYTFSVYIKGLTATTAKIGLRDNTTGTITSTTVSVTTEWQRISVTATTGAATTSLGTIIGATNGTIAIWGAQLVQGTTAGDYARTDSTTRAISYIAPNGYANAQKLVEDTATSEHRLRVTTIAKSASAVMTLSIYSKATSGRYLCLSMENSGVGAVVTYDVATNTSWIYTDAGWSVSSASIVNVGNGWYRCAFTSTTDTNTSMNIRVSLTNITGIQKFTTYTGDGTSGIYIYGAQLSNSASLDPYVYNPAAALTSVAYYAPRFTYDPVTLAPQGLLIEEARTNTLLNSEAFDNVSWSLAGATVSANTSTSPSGLTNADKLVEDTSTGVHNVFVSSIAAGSYTASVFAKASGRNWLILRFEGVDTYFDLQNGVVGTIAAGNTASIVSYGNGWYRCIISRVTAVSSSLTLRLATSGSVSSYTGDGTSGILLWGSQLEVGTFATSYIPTGASSVTRAADVAVVQGNNFSNWFSKNEGSLYVQYTPMVISGLNKVTALVPIVAGQYAAMAAGAPQTGWYANGLSTLTNPTVNVSNKEIIAFDPNGNFVGVVNGGTVASSSSSDYKLTSTQLSIGSRNSDQYLNGTLKQISYYNKRLANATLQGLTA